MRLFVPKSGVAFVDISVPADPFYLGKLPVHAGKSSWCDVKTYNDHAYIVTEDDLQGLQVFNLNLLKEVTSPTLFEETTHVNVFGNAHNIAINEESGYAYVVGSNKCNGGLLMFNLESPLNPTEEGCFSSDGYTHDVQCVNYNGPDSTYSGKEICFASNEDTVTIVDVTNKENLIQISRTTYTGSRYTHQGWLTEDHKYFLFNDELDEYQTGVKTTTWVMNVENLSTPVLKGKYTHDTNAIDHNLYIKNNKVYEANYRAGLRVLEIGNLEEAELTEVAYFDVYGLDDNARFNGAWSSYPFFESGNVIISSIEGGLFTVKQGDPGPTPSPTTSQPTTSPAPSLSPITSQPTTSPAPSSSCRFLEVVGKTDNYPLETDWQVFDASNAVVLSADRPLPVNGDFRGEKCLENGEHTFKITDSYGDGICCNYGNGFYRLTLDGNVIEEGGEFESEEEVVFEVGATSPSTGPPVTSPTSPPVTSPTGPACDIPMRMGMWTDNSNNIKYRLRDDDGVNLFENTNVGSDTTYFEEECLDFDTTYTFEIEDPDGLCCNNGYGFATLNVNGNMKVITKFTGTVTVVFDGTLGDTSFGVSSMFD